MRATRIALIHATALAIDPVNQAFQSLWPDATLQNVLDDSLSRDHAAAGALTADMVERFIDLANYAKRVGCQGILFTCSAFGEAIEAAARSVGIPTLKPNEAMFEQALRMASDRALKHNAAPGEALNIGLVATFAASLVSMGEEFRAMSASLERPVHLHTVFVPNAMAALAQGRADEHHQLVAQCVQELPPCEVIMLAQFSMAAAHATSQATTHVPILTSPECAVLALQKRMNNV